MTAREVDKPNGSNPPELPHGGDFRVEVHQPEKLFRIAHCEEYNNSGLLELCISNTEFEDPILANEDTTLRTDSKIDLPAGIITRDGRELTPGIRRMPTFLLLSELEMSQIQLSRVDGGYFSADRIKKIQDIMETLGSQTNFEQGGLPNHHQSPYINALIIEHKGVFADADMGFPNRTAHENWVRTWCGDTAEEREILEEEVLPKLGEIPRIIRLKLRGRNAQIDKSLFLNDIENSPDFVEQLTLPQFVFKPLKLVKF